jgi:DNA-binding NarL/FixJ family response regulator
LSGAKYQNVIVAGAQPLERLAISTIVASVFGCRSVASLADFASVELSLDHDTELAVLDLDLPGLESPDDIRHLRIKYPQSKLVVISANCSTDSVLAVLGAGAHGYVPKTLPYDALRAAFRSIADGQVFVPAQISELASQPNSSGSRQNLSDRQRQVLRLICDGNSNKEIGRVLRIAEATVKVHVSAAFRAMGVNNRARAIVAFRHFDEGQGALRLTG